MARVLSHIWFGSLLDSESILLSVGPVVFCSMSGQISKPTVCCKKVFPEVVCHFLSNHLEFLREIFLSRRRLYVFGSSVRAAVRPVRPSVIHVVVFARDSVCCKRAYYAIAIPSVRPSVRLSVRHTGDSCKNGWS